MNRKRTILLMIAVVAMALGSLAPVALAGKPVVHGIVSQGYLKSSEYNYLNNSKDGSFQFNEVMLNVSTYVTPKLRVGAQVMARNLGNSGNEDVVLDWAFGDYRVSDNFGIRVGKVKMPHGLYNQTRDVDMVRNAILLPQAVYPEIYRDVMNGFEGASLYGSFSFGESRGLEYEVYGGTVDTDRTGFNKFLVWYDYQMAAFGAPMPSYFESEEVSKLWGGALRYATPLEGLRVGASGFTIKNEYDGLVTAPYGTFRPHVTTDVESIFVLSAEYTRDRWLAAFELTRTMADLTAEDVLVPTGLPDPAPPYGTVDLPTQSDHRGGWYGMLNYQASDKVQVGGYYSKYYPDYGVREGDGFDYYMNDVAFTVRYDINDYWLVKLEGHLMKGVGGVSGAANVGSAFDEESWNLFGVKSTFFF